MWSPKMCEDRTCQADSLIHFTAGRRSSHTRGPFRRVFMPGQHARANLCAPAGLFSKGLCSRSVLQTA